ncbi:MULTISPECIES: hypothetical protein [Mycolicibacter]|uniref:Uncharacterized protein n=2 Tax=Mycolicibacter TaxID=1073531 RepID=A0ABU5XMC2_9MYCO|nr:MULTISPECIES: hypothetical protein [unclassified Mycolicibacter]MEB3023356.1 hypothetical protein [Mycolicibacter sp. MYC098]MEB3033697.1 hypothetical protein [Mycolicibacter sp. MYC340]
MLVHLDDDGDVAFVEQLSLDEARSVLITLSAQVAAVREHLDCLEEDAAQERAVEAGAERARELYDELVLGGAA